MNNKIDSIFESKELSRILQNIYNDLEKNNEVEALGDWFSNPPRFTTVRVNFPTTIQAALLNLQKIINNKFASRKKKPPLVHIHKLIPDLLVIPSNANESPIVPVEKEVVVDIHCGAAVLRGADIFAPGVIGAPASLQAGDIVSVYADLTGKCLKGCLKFDIDQKRFIGNGKSAFSRQQLFSKNKVSSGIAIEMLDLVNDCPSLGDNVLGSSMFLQNLPSVLCGHILDPKPNTWVLDMCAAPGGKTTHLASLMKNTGVIIALDKTLFRISKLKSNIDLTEYSNIHSFAFDSTKAFDNTKSSDDSKVIRMTGLAIPPPYPPDLFDFVLLDAPCSALGQRPQLINKTTVKEVGAFSILQRKLFSTAIQLLQPNGKMVYSTCSITLQENEELVSWALHKYQFLELISQSPMIGGKGKYATGLNHECQKAQRFDVNSPGIAEDSDTIGFFIAKFIKK